MGHLGGVLGGSWIILGHLAQHSFQKRASGSHARTGLCKMAFSLGPSAKIRSFSLLRNILIYLRRIHATTLSILSALPVPMLGQVYVKWWFRRGETLGFGVWGGGAVAIGALISDLI